MKKDAAGKTQMRASYVHIEGSRYCHRCAPASETQPTAEEAAAKQKAAAAAAEIRPVSAPEEESMDISEILATRDGKDVTIRVRLSDGAPLGVLEGCPLSYRSKQRTLQPI